MDNYTTSSSEAVVGRRLIEQLEDVIDDIFDVDVDYIYDDSKSVDDNMDAFVEELELSESFSSATKLSYSSCWTS